MYVNIWFIKSEAIKKIRRRFHVSSCITAPSLENLKIYVILKELIEYFAYLDKFVTLVTLS